MEIEARNIIYVALKLKYSLRTFR